MKTLENSNEFMDFLREAKGCFSIVTGERGMIEYLTEIGDDAYTPAMEKSIYIRTSDLEVYMSVNEVMDVDMNTKLEGETLEPHDRGGFTKSYKYLIFDNTSTTPKAT